MGVHIDKTKLEGKPPWSHDRKIGHYGGELDKRDSNTEGERPYAWRWYRELQAMRGSAYTTDDDTLVHIEHVAIARAEAGRTRAAEKLHANQTPATSDERLESHVNALGVRTAATDSRSEVRARCAAKDQAAKGNNQRHVDTSLETLLGDAYVRSWRQRGTDLANPPTLTFWPGVNAGPAAYSLGGGAWLSERANLVIEVQQPDTMTEAEFLDLMNVHLFHHLTWLLPAYMTFNWALEVSTGFVLDVSQLDFGAIVP